MLRYQAIDLRDIADVYALRLSAILNIPLTRDVDSMVLKDIMSLACSMGVFGRSYSTLLDFINIKDDRIVHPDNTPDGAYLDDPTVAEKIEALEDDMSVMIETRVRTHLGDFDENLKIHRIALKAEFVLVISYTDFDTEDIQNIKAMMEEPSIEKDLKAYYQETP